MTSNGFAQGGRMERPVDASLRARLRSLGALSIDPLANSSMATAEERALQELATRRRKLALLLYLLRQSRPVSRELLATLFWGGESPERARHNLTEALSHIRRAFGREAIATRVQDVALAPDLPLLVDVREFESAVADGALERAAELYAGPFLAGVFLERAPAFDDWAARERTHLSRRFADVCRALVPRHLAAGDAASAESLAERWLDEDLEDADAATMLLQSIAHDGTRDAIRRAIERGERLCARIAGELESEPDAHVMTMLRQLEDRLLLAPAQAIVPTLAQLVSQDITQNVSHVVASAPSTTYAQPPGDARPGRRSVAWRAFAALGVAAVLLLTVWASWQSRRASGDARAWVLVADAYDPVRDPVLSASLRMALGVALAQSEGIFVVPQERTRAALRFMQRPDTTALDEQNAVDVAMRVGASHVVIPSVARLGSQRALSARLLDVATGRTVAVEQADAVAEDAMLRALGDLAHRLQRRLGGGVGGKSVTVPLPEVTTSSLGALQEYASGQALFARLRADSALLAYRRAIALDAGFAMAHAAAGLTLHTLNLPAAGDSALTTALALRARLSAREAMRIEAARAQWRRQSDTAIAILDRWLAMHPFDRDTRSALAYNLFRAGRHAQARDAYVALLAIDSLDARDWVNLSATTSALESPDDLSLARRAAARAFALMPALRTDVVQNHEYGTLLVRAGFSDSAEVVFREMLGEDAGRAARGYRSLGLLALWNAQPTDAATAFRQAARAHHDAGEPLGEVRARLLLAWALSDMADSLAARAELDAVRMLSRTGVAEPTVLYWAGKAMARQRMTSAANEMLDALKRRAVVGNTRHESAALLLQGEIDVARGRAQAAVAGMERGVALDSSVITRESLAYAARAAGALARADSLDRVLASKPRFGWEGTLAQQTARQRLAKQTR